MRRRAALWMADPSDTPETTGSTANDGFRLAPSKPERDYLELIAVTRCSTPTAIVAP